MLSYARGSELPILEVTIAELLDRAAAKFPDSEALVSRHQNIRLTWRGLQQQVSRTAAGLWGLGIRPGDRVGMWATTCVEWVMLQAALSRIGGVLVNMNPAYRSHEVRFILRRSGLKAIFLREQDSRANYLDILREARDGQDLALEHVILLDGPSWDEMLANGVQPDPVEAGPGDVVNIQYTSGTTGAPKGVLLTNRNLVNNGLRIGGNMRITNNDRICAPVPLYHCFGCVIGVMVAMNYGAALVLPSASFDPEAALRAASEERCTAIYGVPTMFIAEFEQPSFNTYDLSSIRTGVMAGSPCPIELMKRVVREMNCRELTICYGQTESSPVITMSATTDDVGTRVSTVGRALPSTEVKLVDPATNETVPAGVQGELCTRGYLVMKGYDGDPAATAKTVDSEGWLHTGDLATMREDGCFRITGRAKEMISRGGEKVYPREVEEFLHTHPKIADVYVLGLPHPRLGESVAAWIKLKSGCTATLQEIRQFCKGKIAYFKIPEHIRFVTAFPQTANGKVQKYIMREHEIRELGLDELTRIATA